MKVRNLIKVLQEQDPELEVVVLDGSNWETISGVEPASETFINWTHHGAWETDQVIKLI